MPIQTDLELDMDTIFANPKEEVPETLGVSDGEWFNIRKENAKKYEGKPLKEIINLVGLKKEIISVVVAQAITEAMLGRKTELLFQTSRVAKMFLLSGRKKVSIGDFLVGMVVVENIVDSFETEYHKEP